MFRGLGLGLHSFERIHREDLQDKACIVPALKPGTFVF